MARLQTLGQAFEPTAQVIDQHQRSPTQLVGDEFSPLHCSVDACFSDTGNACGF